MKIIRVRYLNKESISDVLIATNVSSFYAEIIVRMLNTVLGGIHSADFYRAVGDNYKLMNK